MITLEFGVAVNIFWKHLEDSAYDSRDTYGNKDLCKATRAMQVTDGAIKLLEELPEEYRDFYARRLVIKIQNRCYKKNENRWIEDIFR